MVKRRQNLYEVLNFLGSGQRISAMETNVPPPTSNASLKEMKFFTSPRRRLAQRAALAAPLLLLGIGCASPGDPHPPSLKLPEIVKDLSATRVGDQVRLQWTTPSKTTDGLLIKGPITAEICRTTASAAAAATRKTVCTPVTRVAVQPGPSQAADSLPPALTQDPPQLLLYSIQLLNAHQHTAGPSPAVFAASGAAPPPVEQLHASNIPTGAMLEWKPQPATNSYVELDRLIEGAPATQPKSSANKPTTRLKTQKPQSAASSTPGPAATKLFKSPPPPTEVKLRTPQQVSDPGGTLDRSAQSGVQTGAAYQYTAQRVRSLTLDNHALEIRSLQSPAVALQLRDTFPPQVPTGLAAVPGPSSIDLSWEPVPDADLAGYILYRQPVSSAGSPTGPATRLNSVPTTAPSYRDETAVPGQLYAYRVSAIDNTGNESGPSIAIQDIRREH